MQQSLAKSVSFCKSIARNVPSPNTCTTGHSVINEKQSTGFSYMAQVSAGQILKESSKKDAQ